MEHVHVYIDEGLADWELGYAIAEINTGRFGHGRSPAYRIRTVAERPEAIHTMGGLRLLPDQTLDEIRPAKSAMLLLIGNTVWDRGGGDRALRLAAAFLDAGRPVGAICGATLGCARAGLLDDRHHTSGALAYLQGASGYHGAALYEDRPAVADRGLVTAGPAHPLEFAREVLRVLRVYDEPTLQAWYGLFKTADERWFRVLMAS